MDNFVNTHTLDFENMLFFYGQNNIRYLKEIKNIRTNLK